MSAEEARPLAGLGDLRHDHPPGASLTTHDEAPSDTRLVVSGVLAEARLLSDGRRQIVMLRIPGDLVVLNGSDTGSVVLALTLARTVEAQAFMAIVADRSPATEALRAAWTLAQQA